jgi:nucleoside phosphorylase
VSPQAPVLLIVALAVERRALGRRLTAAVPQPAGGSPALRGTLGGHPVIVVQAGLGAERARRAALRAVPPAGCSGLWSVGLAGGLDAGLRPGDLLVPDAVLAPTGRGFPCPSASWLRAALAGGVAQGGVLVTAAAPVLAPADKRALASASGAVAVDMEAAGVAEAAAALRVPWLAVKVVLDPADRALPAFLLAGTGDDGSLRPWALAAAAGTPRRLRTLVGFARLSQQSLAVLGRGTRMLLDAWGRLDATRAVQ